LHVMRTIWQEPFDIVKINVMACVPICDDTIRDYVILFHCLALVID